MSDWLDRNVPELMQRCGVPGVVITVVDATGPRLSRSYGHTDDAESTPVTPETVFEGASLGKPLFAYAMLAQAAPPHFELDASIEGYLRTKLVDDRRGPLITGRHLLSHSSGLVHSEAHDGLRVVTHPGSAWQYSGLGFVVLQRAGERLWGDRYDELFQGLVRESLGMVASSYLPPRDASRPRAVGHDRQGRRFPRTEWTEPNVASSLHTTALDYGRFLRTMLAESAAADDTSAGRRMLQPQISVDESLGLSWGLGWAIATVPGDTLFLHWGSNPGYKSLAVGSTAQGVAVVILTNGDNGLELATSIIPAVLGRDYPFLRFYMLHPDD